MNRAILYIALLICCINLNRLAAQSADEPKRNFQLLKPGLDEEGVKNLIGSPTRIENFKLLMNAQQDTATFWYYSINNWTMVFINHHLDRIEISRDKLLIDIQQWAEVNNKEGIRLIYGK
ncbi:MAG: hypothetical protein ACK45I_10120 [Bacteroidota bacterium]|jgi:hypothetical protein